MRYSLCQEFYKLIHKKVTWLAPCLMILLMLVLGLTYDSDRWLIMSSFGINEWISLVLVLVGSTMFSMEFQNRTILTLLYKTPSRMYVYLSKFIVICTYDLFLHIIAMIFTMIFNVIMPNLRFSLWATYQYQQSLFVNMVLTSTIDMFTTLFIISLIFLMSCLISENSVVIAVNLGLVFLGQGISNDILNFYHRSFS